MSDDEDVKEPSPIEKDDIDSLILTGRNAAYALKTLKAKIISAHHDYSVAKTVGASVNIAGVAATVGGILLAPVTAGLSLTLTAGGIVGTIAGTGTSITTGIIEAVKTREWAEEIMTALKDYEDEVQKIGEKIMNHQLWKRLVKEATLAGKTVTYLALKGPAAAQILWDITQYLKIVLPKYGAVAVAGDSFAAITFASTRVPCKFLLNCNQALTTSLAKVGIKTAGITALRLTLGLSVIGVGLDIYTIVDTWANDPKLVTQIDEIINHLEGTSEQLTQFSLKLKKS